MFVRTGSFDGRDYSVQREAAQRSLAQRGERETSKTRLLQLLQESLVKGKSEAWQDKPRVPDLLKKSEFIPGTERYTYIEDIGEGATSRVMEVQDEKLHRRVAMKILDAPGTDLRDFFSDILQREARTLARMNDPAFLDVYDFFITEFGDVVIVMELVGKDTPTMQDFLAEVDYLEVPQIFTIFDQIGEALERVFRKYGLRYHDLKLANIFVNRQTLQVRIGDIGSSNLVLPELDGFTPMYMSPEYWRKEESVGLQSEVFSLALMFYEMVTKTRAFEEYSNDIIDLIRIMEGKAYFEEIDWNLFFACLGIGEEDTAEREKILTVFRTALHPEWSQRYNSPTEFFQALKVALHNVRQQRFLAA